MHLDGDNAVTLTGLAAAACDIEREAARLPAASTRFGRRSEEIADVRECAGIRSRIRTRRVRPMADWSISTTRPIYSVPVTQAFTTELRAVRRCDIFMQDVIEEGGLSRARNPRDTDKLSKRYVHILIFQVMQCRTFDFDRTLLTGLAFFWDFNLSLFTKIAERLRSAFVLRRCQKLVQPARGNDRSPMRTGTGPISTI